MYSKDSVEKAAMLQISWEPWIYSKAAVKKRQSSMNSWAIIWAIRTLLPCSRRNMSNIYEHVLWQKKTHTTRTSDYFCFILILSNKAESILS